MVLLVAMVLAKAYLFDYSKEKDAIAGVDESVMDFVAMSTNFGADEVIVSSVSDLVASNFNSPELSDFEVQTKQVEPFQPSYDLNDMAAVESELPAEDEIIPMDYVSNTGYGMWRTSSPEDHGAQEDRTFEGKVPLDRGNTITGDISRLFPRNP